MSNRLIGLIGKKRVGKDTFASQLVEHRGFTRVAFADPLKEFALRIDPYVLCNGLLERLSVVVETEGWEAAKSHREVRRLLQEVGVAQRELDPAYWVRLGMQRADEVGGPVVVTDVRFPNEAGAIKARGGLLVRIVRPGVDDGDSHASETALDGYPTDITVHNVGTEGDLRRLARVILL